MKKCFTKVFSVLIAVALLATVFTGCSSQNGAQNSTKSGNGQQVTIRYMRWGLPEEMNGTKKIIAAFEKSHSNIKVSLESCSWDQYWEKVQTEIASNTAPSQPISAKML